MKRIWGAGILPAMAGIMLSTGGSQALAQTMNNIPVVKAVFDRDTVEQAADAAIESEEKTLDQLVEEYRGGDALDREANCLATAVYFEARGESLEGQLAVADVVLNRAESGQYPSDWCSVVKQKAQFSFVKNGRFPKVTEYEAWEDAKAIARIAIDGASEIVRGDVLWYHADYVAPTWRRNLNQVTKVGVHIFYRA
ncbi:cell wall hydrolase [Sphingomicrobium nitratireducens]|uniref:cell wall hydrolase n=1 Tax=Sphingomicrobium nitratireducens TaxID=2964666 RepID=UPI0022405F52|nr:cell wall hydrolase [Sphingomicrobium nitratireducens]